VIGAERCQANRAVCPRLGRAQISRVAAAVWIFVACIAVTAVGGCNHRRDAKKLRSGSASTSVAAAPSVAVPEEFEQLPQLLYLPDAGDVAIGSEYVPVPNRTATTETPPASRRCPTDMVDVGGTFCIDRYEAELVDATSGQELSPYYPPDARRARNLHAHWEKQRAQCDIALGRDTPLPDLPDWQLEDSVEPMAKSEARVVPSGYLDANTAERACQRAGKRLCTAVEWVTACRGQANRQFPYGNQFVNGACNVFREAHPAYLLHGNASEGHLDPRLNRVVGDGGPLLRATGTTPLCRSEWGNDAIFDMVGNLDEWVDDAAGAFHGGFYARPTRLGCDARITAHPRQYSDYSLGVRCCKSVQ
jgi:formylglycine-generating enzyme